MGLARYVSTKSKDSSTKVGAVIVDNRSRVVSLGFNGPPRKVRDDYKDREQKLRRTVHAELNAIFFANRPDLEGCTIYVTHPTCSRCAADLIQNGITRVVFPPAEPDFFTRWGGDMDEAFLMYKEANVEVVFYEEKEVS